MPFWYGGMWVFPMLMPLIMGGVVYFLYKKGVFDEMCNSNQSQIESKNQKGSNDFDPLTILKKRYAEGEISTEEYQEMKEELKKD